MNSLPQFVIVIPARLQSSRFPRKLAQPLYGNETVLSYLYRRAIEKFGTNNVVVATDASSLADSVKRVSKKALVWSSESRFRNGTERVAKCASELDLNGLIVNIQADKPSLDFEIIRRLVSASTENSDKSVFTPFAWLPRDEVINRKLVSVVANHRREAMYFSRATLPEQKEAPNGHESDYVMAHIGVYAYSRDALDWFIRRHPSISEETESLEQLRFVQNGYPVQLVETASRPFPIDSMEDLNSFRQRISR